MKLLLSNFIAYLVLGYVLFYLLYSFFPSTLWLIPINIIVIILLLTCFHRMKRSYQIISGILIAIGGYFLIASHAAAADWLLAVLPNAGVASLLITVPLLGMTLYFEPYLECLEEVLPKYIQKPFHFYSITALFSAFLSSLLNIAAVPFLFQLFSRVAEKYPPRLFHYALSRGISSNLMWSPSWISVAVALQASQLSWRELMPLGIPLAAAGITITLLMGRLELYLYPVRDHWQSEITNKPIDAKNMKYLYKLAAQMALIIIFILLLEIVTHKSALVTVPLVSLSLPFLLAVLLRRTTVFKNRFHTYFTVQLPKMYNNIILFSAIGLFGYGLGLSEIRTLLPAIIQQLGISSPFLMIILLVSLVGFVGFFGIHPIISISTISIAIAPSTIGLSQMQMAGAFLNGYMFYTMLSPFAGTGMLLAAIFKTNSLNMSLKLNFSYAMTFCLINTLLLVSFF